MFQPHLVAKSHSSGISATEPYFLHRASDQRDLLKHTNTTVFDFNFFATAQLDLLTLIFDQARRGALGRCSTRGITFKGKAGA